MLRVIISSLDQFMTGYENIPGFNFESGDPSISNDNLKYMADVFIRDVKTR
jgi:hypothetical protein